jgi:hypothetical protein
MINFWLDHDRNLPEALTLATREYETRKDIFTCDSFAWALFKNGRLQEAKTIIGEALRTGSKDTRINSHAETIYKTLRKEKGTSRVSSSLRVKYVRARQLLRRARRIIYDERSL